MKLTRCYLGDIFTDLFLRQKRLQFRLQLLGGQQWQVEGMFSRQAGMCWVFWGFFLFFKNLFILFLAALDLRCCARAFSSCGERGLLFVVVRGLLIAVASLVAEHGL